MVILCWNYIYWNRHQCTMYDNSWTI